ncbi:MAG TPA: PIN domain-containing protein [Bryobacteraceae bacterium]|nr:PIN domain-containing protein [Bryobacteraceae bacterium]
MSGKAFFDTNVLLYKYGSDARKRTQATALFDEETQSANILLSTQVVQEFYAAGSRKLGIPRSQLREVTLALLDLPIIVVTAFHIARAIENEQLYTISFWDALILAAAESGGAEVLYTEDLNHGQKYGTVLVQNPFLD